MYSGFEFCFLNDICDFTTPFSVIVRKVICFYFVFGGLAICGEADFYSSSASSRDCFSVEDGGEAALVDEAVDGVAVGRTRWVGEAEKVVHKALHLFRR